MELCSDDCNLNIYKKESYELQISIRTHSDWIYAFTELSDGRIITCFADKTMKKIKLNEDKYKMEQWLCFESNRNKKKWINFNIKR